jgi:DNA repair exonuclease SbcCD ATPase subunit
MIFKRLTLFNFLTYKGQNTLDFKNAETGKQTLLLVLGPNNSGKTNIIKALKFLFYGNEWGGNLANLSALADNNSKSWVEATIIHQGKEITFRRHFRNKTIAAEGSLERLEHTRTGDKFVVDQGETQRILHSLVPEVLFDFFYFQGETLAEIFTGKGGKSAGISSALSSLLHESDWLKAIRIVQSAKNKADCEIDELVAANTQYKNQRNLIANLGKNVTEREQSEAAAMRDRRG